MEPSYEIKQVMRRLYEREAAGDMDSIDQFFSHQAGVIFIGTDRCEWCAGNGKIEQAHSAQMRELGGGCHYDVKEQNAFAEGSVGWSVDRVTIRGENGLELPVRITTILHKENGEWKIVHHHTSTGVAAGEVFGQEYAIALND